MRGAQPQLLLDLLALDHLLDPRRARVGDVEQVEPGGAEAGDDQRVALQLGMARGRAGVPAEVVQLVADVGHIGAPDDLTVARGSGVDIDNRDEVGPVDAGALVERRHVDELLGRLLTGNLRGRVARPAVLIAVVIVDAHRPAPSSAAGQRGTITITQS
jgi:hypothetical protein